MTNNNDNRDGMDDNTMIQPKADNHSSHDAPSSCYDSEDDDDDGLATTSGCDTDTDQDGGGSGERSNDGNSDAPGNRTDKLTSNETKAVNRSKLLVYLAILVAASIVGSLIYYFTHQEETQDFEREFIAYSNEIMTTSETNAENVFAQLHMMSTTVTSYAVATDAVWPYVTLPHFDLRSREAEDLSGIELIAFAPLVPDENRSAWERYAWTNQSYIDEDLMYRRQMTSDYYEKDPGPISERIYPYSPTGLAQYNEGSSEYYVPIWQLGPLPRNASIINLDLYSHADFRASIQDVREIRHQLLSKVVDFDFILKYTTINQTSFDDPRSFVVEPVYESFLPESDVVGFLFGEIMWTAFFEDALPKAVDGILVTVKDTCGSEFTCLVNGNEATFIGYGDLHDTKYDTIVQTHEFVTRARYDGFDNDADRVHCDYRIMIYPTSTFESGYYTNLPALYTSVVILVFFCTALIFALYDYMVYRRQNRLLDTATRTQAIVSSLFPKEFQERMMESANINPNHKASNGGGNPYSLSGKGQLKGYLDDKGETSTSADTYALFRSKPIADLFPEVTLMFADIVGFTAWSSTREPSQVFTLLETIFHEFDQIAKQRRVFKVETVGDCYVAVVGLPDPRKDHAVVMARFARDCLGKFDILMRRLEQELGPDTTDLGMRFGLHSGPVTAGVLRGERSRFQLFGDTMNTTARIESTGVKNRIHLSQDTADLLTTAGKGHWVKPRHDKVYAKGKGELSTYWLEIRRSAGSSRSGTSENTTSDHTHSDGAENDFETTNFDHIQEKQPPRIDLSGSDLKQPLTDKTIRLVNWNTDILKKILQQIVTRRKYVDGESDPESIMSTVEREQLDLQGTVLEEVTEYVKLPMFDSRAACQQEFETAVDLDYAVMEQLQSYVQTIAAMYRDNPFHCYEHASHVTMSVVKLLSRIVAPDISCDDENNLAKDLHDHTFGITSDPLTQFAVVLSALIHDVDHTGVPNSQLIKEQTSIAAVYKNKSVAEQNSVDIAWDLLMQDSYKDLRRAIYSTQEEFQRFRQLVVNSVMATDIMDKELNQARKGRWDKVFLESNDNVSGDELIHRKATIVIEHLIQASDVAHTMQHWHIYRKWNQRLFFEMYKAYQEGRLEKDPSETWYEGEIGFFDFYIIPLAKKLQSCGVFGVSSDEYLTYAKQNRKEWEVKGKLVTAEMIELVKGITDNQ